MNTPETQSGSALQRVVRRRECPHCHESLERYEDPKAVEIIGTLEKEIADNERWMREVLTDFRIPFDDHKIGRRLAFTQWMFERQSSNRKAEARRTNQNPMKWKLIILVATALAVASSAWFCVTAQPQKPSPKVQWMNDGVYYSTNSWAWDYERNKTNPQPSNFYYTKEVITTYKVRPFYLRAGDRAIELGAREDGVIVWRTCE